jgi:Uma2 family endonuclease
MRVRISATGLYTYPDVTVVCGTPEYLDSREDTLLNPTLIIEVLSPSTEAYDRGDKFRHFRSLESLRAYLLVSSDKVQVDLFTREGDHWLLTSVDDTNGTLEIKPANCRLQLAEIYDQVEFEPAPLRPQNT